MDKRRQVAQHMVERTPATAMETVIPSGKTKVQPSSMTTTRRRATALGPRLSKALRDALILSRYRAGENLASIGASFDLTRERICQIVKDSGAPMPWEYQCAAASCTTSPRTPNRYCSHHLVRLERYGDPLGNKPVGLRLRDQHGTMTSYSDGGCRCNLCRKALADRRREYAHRAHPEMRWYKPRTP